jgi:hypothetical protein
LSDIASHLQLRGAQDAELGVLGPVALRRRIADKAQQRPAGKAPKHAAPVGVRIEGEENLASITAEGRLQQLRGKPSVVGE